MSAKCKNCSITRKSAYITYDGYVSPYIQKECVKERKKCSDPFCMTCALEGGHIVKLHENGRHKWESESNETN